MIQGLDKFNRRWAAVPKNVRAAAKEALEQIAEGLVQDMKRVVARASGELAESIGWTWGDAPKGSMVIGTVAGSEYGTLRITVYAGGGDAFHAVFVEFGTAPHSLGKDHSGLHPGTNAQPFFWPVWRTRRRGAKSKVTRAINKAIKLS